MTKHSLESRQHLKVAGDALNALERLAEVSTCWLYRQVLQQPLGDLGDFVRVSRPARLPGVLTKEETLRVPVCRSRIGWTFAAMGF